MSCSSVGIRWTHILWDLFFSISLKKNVQFEINFYKQSIDEISYIYFFHIFYMLSYQEQNLFGIHKHMQAYKGISYMYIYKYLHIFLSQWIKSKTDRKQFFSPQHVTAYAWHNIVKIYVCTYIPYLHKYNKVYIIYMYVHKAISI